MKKSLLVLVSIFFSIAIQTTANAATLMDVYHQALMSDQIFYRAIYQRLSTKQGVPISLSALLPTLGAAYAPTIQKTESSGSANLIGNNTQRGYTISVTLSQTLFDFSKASNLASQFNISKEADATLNAALQDLMVRVASAYFAVLNDEDNLRYVIATKEAYAKQLDQVSQQYKVGIKTITDVYTAQASYDNSVAGYITAQNTLADDKENLRVITGVFYPNLSKLSEDFPLISPHPIDVEEWVSTAQRQNWSIKASQYNAASAKDIIKQQFAGHFPTLNLQAGYNINFNRTNASVEDAFIERGTLQTSTPSATVTLNFPIVQGGLVVANTRKAQYDYQVAITQLEQQIRNTINNTRQSYLGILSGIGKIKADKQTIKSSISSWQGLEAAYQVGTETLVDVLNQQKAVFQAQQQYASDRYAYVNSLLTLKQASGTLCTRDLEAINSWLLSDSESFQYDQETKSSHHAVKPVDMHEHEKNHTHIKYQRYTSNNSILTAKL